MRDTFPKPVSGISAEANWQNRMRNATQNQRLQSGPGYRIRQYPGGQSIEILPSAGGRGRASGINWKGEFNFAAAYKVGDLVRVSAVPIGEAGDGKNYTGIWLCVVANNGGNQPVYPEPLAPNTCFWVLISMAPRELNVADSATGSKKQLIAANDPY